MKTIENILQFVLNAGSNSIEVFGGEFEGGYELQQCPDEITNFLFEFQNKHIDNFLEIGVAAAGNTRIFSDFLKLKNVFTMDLDVHDSIARARERNISNLKHSGSLISFYGDSHSDKAKEWLIESDSKFDMVFIDGDHTENGVLQDTHLVIPFLNDNAYVIYHDTEINGGSNKFDKKLKNGLISELKHEKDFISQTKFKKGISIYRYGK